MSFARKVKEEIKEQIDKKRHCQIAELAAYFAFIGSVVMTEEGGYEIHFHTENLTVLQKSYILFRKAFRTTRMFQYGVSINILCIYWMKTLPSSL